MNLRKKNVYAFFSAVIFFIAFPLNHVFANGYNHISAFAIPIIFIVIGFFYIPFSLVPGAISYMVIKKIFKRKISILRLFIGSLLGGESGLITSFLIYKYLDRGPGYSSYHYTLYPALLAGGAFLGIILSVAFLKKKSV